jgi:lysine 2,3-aminomutase
MSIDLTNHVESKPLWTHLLRESITNTIDLETFLEVKIPHTSYPILIPRPYAQKIKDAGVDSALWKQFIPDQQENLPQGLEDPISDHDYSKGHGIIHRYSNRLLFSPTEICPIQCRYCFRKNELHQQNDIFKAKISALENYLFENPQVEEVIFTGGDPLILSNSKLEFYLNKLAQIPSVKLIRFHTRTPIILPERIDKPFLEILKKYATKFNLISLALHTNHTSEWTPLFLKKLQLLRSLPINLLSQSVLLKGVNDNVEDLTLLFKMLSFHGVNPYYLHHPDQAKGTKHFQISLEEGRRLYHAVKQRVSGFILPHYVVELPQGKGKALAFNSQYFEEKVSDPWIDKDGHQIHFRAID